MDFVKFFSSQKQKGATVTELGLLVGLISILLLGSLTSVGQNMSSLFGTVNQKLVQAGSVTETPSATDPDLDPAPTPDPDPEPDPAPDPEPLSCDTTVSGGATVNLATVVQAQCGWDGSEELEATITLTGIFSSASTANPAIRVNFPSTATITIINNATIQGAGGAGGSGGWQNSNPGGAGGAGGPAMEINSTISLENNGTIWGGGGGGGGGASLHFPNYYAGGGAGGGGAGRNAGAAGYRHAVQYGPYPLGYAGAAGTATSGGHGGAAQSYNGYSSGAGGAGGGPGQAGTAGGAGYGSYSTTNRAAGGAAGLGIWLNGGTVTWITQGDVRPTP